ncbi:hypothetical protein GOP47_0025383 [Adiantum capillus-veneris]|uniref:Uncharacterized protein n=1 Tax=Adiantum capillus-veneris TaxID=13818 RepID=A0A9D4Z2Y6_ADICA|nr:hypothetical protein GOP47_0025383 [Adiantum capillus-veneris]
MGACPLKSLELELQANAHGNGPLQGYWLQSFGWKNACGIKAPAKVRGKGPWGLLSQVGLREGSPYKIRPKGVMQYGLPPKEVHRLTTDLLLDSSRNFSKPDGL